MATIIGGIGTSHVPAIGRAMADGRQQEAYWKTFFGGYIPARDWLERTRPDVAIVFYNDHGLNFFLDNMPTFAVGAADHYGNADEGWGLPVSAPYPGAAELSWRLIEHLVEEEFDVATCQQMLVDHAFWIPMQLLWPGEARPVRVIPISINTVQHPLASPARCFRLGQAVGRAVAGWEDELKVVVIGTGGLSHQLDGARAGFINKAFDLQCLEDLVAAPDRLAQLSNHDLIEQGGSQGVELLMWLAMRGALSGTVSQVTSNYHVPISSTAAGLLVLNNASVVEPPLALHRS
jgi:protocatechuate 4,5-dioxygenase beta chain